MLSMFLICVVLFLVEMCGLCCVETANKAGSGFIWGRMHGMGGLTDRYTRGP